MYKEFNAHPNGLKTTDCVVRAIATAMAKDYRECRKELNQAKRELGFGSYKETQFLYKYLERCPRLIFKAMKGEPRLKGFDFTVLHPGRNLYPQDGGTRDLLQGRCDPGHLGLFLPKRLYRLGDFPMKTNFIRKPTAYELIPPDEFVIEKTIVLEKDMFECFLQNPLFDYDFLRENVSHMYCDQNGLFHCIFLTSDSHDYGILVESEGYHYARFAAYLPKALLK